MRILLLGAMLIIIMGQLVLVSDDVLQIPVNTQKTFNLSATGGKAPYTYNASGLPTGITLTGNSISGSVSVVGVFPVLLTVTDADKTTVNKNIFAYVTSPNGASNTQNTTSVTTVTTTTTQSSSGNSGIPSVATLPISAASNIQGSSSNQASSSATVSAGQTQSLNAIGSLTTNSGVRSVQTTGGSFVPTTGSTFPTGSTSNTFGTQTQNTFNPSLNVNSFDGFTQSQPQTISGPIQINLSGANIPTSNSRPSNVFPTQNFPSSSSPNVLIVPTTTPYIDNFSFASSLQSTPTVSTQSTESVFQRQTNVNRAISSLLSLIQQFNATILSIQSNIPNTTSLLNDAIRNQRVAQAQVNSIINQNNTITNNISGV